MTLNITCVFGLPPIRLKGTYPFMFHELKSVAIQMQLNFVPKSIMTDFGTLYNNCNCSWGKCLRFLLDIIHILCFSFPEQQVHPVTSTSLKLFIGLYNVLDYLKVITMMTMLNVFVEHLWLYLYFLKLLLKTIDDDLLAELSAELKNKLNDLLEYSQEQ